MQQESYHRQHPQQKTTQRKEHSLFDCVNSSLTVSTSLSNSGLRNSPLPNHKIDRCQSSNETYLEIQEIMENVNDEMDNNQKKSVAPENAIDFSLIVNGNDLVVNNVENTKREQNQLCPPEDEMVCDQKISAEAHQYRNGFEIGHFAQCLAEDVLEDSLLEARTEIENQETNDININSNISEPIRHLNNIFTENEKNNYSTQEHNVSISIQNTGTAANPELFVSNSGIPHPRKFYDRQHSKSLCLTSCDTKFLHNDCSTNVIHHQPQYSISVQNFEDTLQCPGDLKVIIPNFPDENILPYDQDDECCSNSVVEGLDKLLSDDDFEDDMGHFGQIFTNKPGCDDSIKKPSDDSLFTLEAKTTQGYNLFRTIETIENQMLSQNVETPKDIITNHINYNDIVALPTTDNTSANMGMQGNFCDKLETVITSSGLIVPRVSGQVEEFNRNFENIIDAGGTETQRDEIQALSNISSLLQYFPDEVEKLLSESKSNDEVCNHINQIG